ncbi:MULTISPECIES: hypothetical protein [Helicobacter]|uniref:Lipid/polyisoprenoid-binding YceI-like domain-containing protein n=1 Tax=Helicobacter bilis TaxID=37372 RepID=A0A4U8U8H2_9HELI|nr:MULTISPECIES: hypothetical protein [Helicobacter]MCI7410810.1 hypothetical protein [Helicobacter bilis]MDY5949774.1 hypothetical protein [Helicobacter sp.]TLE07391.1 hypothetical protein LS78_009570 [Helicobacter bilis]TLE08647.1 hypothetical protein LS79_009595 [Helicobacter bilis]
MNKFMTQKIVPRIFGLAVSSFMYANAMYANAIDTKSVKVEFVGYKAPVMADLAGSFKTIQYTFGKDTRSIVGVLQNASATIVPTSSEIPDNEIATDNMNKVFFPTLLGKNNIKVTFIKVVEGEDTGLLRAKVVIGKESSIVPLVYTINNGKFVAKGTLDLHNFSQGEKALRALSDAAAGHAGITWGNVELIFTADVR